MAKSRRDFLTHTSLGLIGAATCYGGLAPEPTQEPGQAPVRPPKRAGRKAKQIPPLRGRRSRSRAEEKVGPSGRDDSGGWAVMSELKLRPPKPRSSYV